MTTQSSLQYSFYIHPFTHTHIHTVHLLAALCCCMRAIRGSASCPRTPRHADLEDWGSNCRPSGWRTTTLPLSHSRPRLCSTMTLQPMQRVCRYRESWFGTRDSPIHKCCDKLTYSKMVFPQLSPLSTTVLNILYLHQCERNPLNYKWKWHEHLPRVLTR